MNFNYSFPAIRGIQAQKEYYTIMCPLNILSKLFVFSEDSIPTEYRAQRKLNQKRVPEISSYMLDNPDGYIFSSITASISGNHEFIQLIENNSDIGTLNISMDSKLLINDGQHRKAAIDASLIENPNLANETISVVLFVDQDLKRSQQMFSDLNNHAVNTSKSLSIAYDHRSPESIMIKNIISNHKGLKKYTDYNNSNLSSKSNKMFTLSNFYKANNRIIKTGEFDKVQAFATIYWQHLANNFKPWQIVFSEQTTPYYSRQDSIASYGVVLEAFGIIGQYLFENNIRNWKSTINKINSIDWDKSNEDDWLYRNIDENRRVNKNNKCIQLTANKIKIKIGLPLTLKEQKTEDSFRRENTNERNTIK